LRRASANGSPHAVNEGRGLRRDKDGVLVYRERRHVPMARARACPHNARLGACARLAAPRGAPEDVRSVLDCEGVGRVVRVWERARREQLWTCKSRGGDSGRHRVDPSVCVERQLSRCGRGGCTAEGWGQRHKGMARWISQHNCVQRAQIYLVLSSPRPLVPLHCLPQAARLTSASP
jgi:hypothetical protein